MATNYSISKPTAGADRSTSPTEVELMTDISDTIADVGTRLDAVEAAPILLTSNDFGESSGAPSFTEAPANRESGWLLDAGTTERIAARFWLPTGWTNVKVTVRIANAGAGAGDYVMRGFADVADVGGSTNDFASSIGSVTTTAGSQWVEQEVVMAASSAGFTAGALNRLWFDRLATDAGDTLANDIVFYAAILEQA